MPHIHDKIDFTVSAYIVHPDLDKILLVHHKKFNGWLQLGGHVELDEDTDTSLMREIEEECGLKVELLATAPGKIGPGVKLLHRPDFMNIHESYTKNHYHLDLRYVAIAKSDKLTLEKDSHNDIRWFTRHELYRPEYGIAPHDRWYFLEAIKMAKAHRTKG